MNESANDTWYEAAAEPEIVGYGPVGGLAVTGQGEPGGAVYATSVQALYGVAGALLGIPAKMRTILRQPVRPAA